MGMFALLSQFEMSFLPPYFGKVTTNQAIAKLLFILNFTN